jgi:TPR repeat protein
MHQCRGPVRQRREDPKGFGESSFLLSERMRAHCGYACGEFIGISCGALAPYYRDGVGGTQDETKALAIYERGCRYDFAPACFDLGYMYSNGRGAARDLARAVGYYELACLLGLSDGCANAGITDL